VAGERLSMRRTREILRGKWVDGRSHRELVRSLEVSVGVISATLSRAQAAGLDPRCWSGLRMWSWSPGCTDPLRGGG